MIFELERLVQLCDGVAVLSLIAYFLTRTRYSSVFVSKTFSPFSALFMALIGGFFYLYGMMTGVQIGPYDISIQMLGPVIAGLVAGTISGLLAGSLGILLHIELGEPIGPFTLIITFLSGIMGGLFWYLHKDAIIRMSHAFLLGFLVASVQFIIGKDGINQDILLPGEVIEGTIDIFLPTILGLCIFVFIINNLRLEEENNRKSFQIEGELTAARQIQIGSLPEQNQEWDHVSLSASLLPASYIGGDLYDYLKLDDEDLYFALGDVSGKGVPAALLMSSTRMILRSKIRETRDPCTLVREINRSFLEDGDSRQFITLIVGIVHLQTGEVCYCNAGHPPPYLITRSATIELESDGNLPAGVLEDEQYIPHFVSLKQGDLLVLVSDGVTEAERGEELYGSERVVRILSEQSPKTPLEVVDLLNHEVKTWTGDNPQSDDCTILALRYYSASPSEN